MPENGLAHTSDGQNRGMHAFSTRRSRPRSLMLVLATLAMLATAGAAHAAAPTPRTPIAQGSARIMGGSQVTANAFGGRWKSIVRMWGLPEYTQGFCGAMLNRPTIVITAAHCVDPSLTENRPIKVRAGVSDLSTNGGQIVDVASITFNPNWTPGEANTSALNNGYDMAILTLADPITVVPPTPVASLAEDAWWGDGSDFAGSDATGAWIAGWGMTNPYEDTSTPWQLRELQTPLWAQTCDVGYANSTNLICNGEPDTDGVAGTTNGMGSCRGDSGGPMIAGDGLGEWRQIGVTSFGYGGTGIDAASQCFRYSYYVRLPAHRAWLDSEGVQIGDSGGCDYCYHSGFGLVAPANASTWGGGYLDLTWLLPADVAAKSISITGPGGYTESAPLDADATTYQFYRSLVGTYTWRVYGVRISDGGVVVTTQRSLDRVVDNRLSIDAGKKTARHRFRVRYSIQSNTDPVQVKFRIKRGTRTLHSGSYFSTSDHVTSHYDDDYPYTDAAYNANLNRVIHSGDKLRVIMTMSGGGDVVTTSRSFRVR